MFPNMNFWIVSLSIDENWALKKRTQTLFVHSSHLFVLFCIFFFFSFHPEEIPLFESISGFIMSISYVEHRNSYVFVSLRFTWRSRQKMCRNVERKLWLTSQVSAKSRATARKGFRFDHANEFIAEDFLIIWKKAKQLNKQESVFWRGFYFVFVLYFQLVKRMNRNESKCICNIIACICLGADKKEEKKTRI